MSELRTEEEQLELIKRWWADNGKPLMIGLVLAVAVVVGWQWWQADQQSKAEAASSSYEQLLDLMSQPERTEEQQSTVLHLADTLRGEHAKSLYADYAALFAAKIHFEKGDYAAAQTALQQVRAQTEHDNVREIAAIREARLLWQQNENSRALALLSEIKSTFYAGEVWELKGDILAEEGRNEEARTAYQQAQSAFNTLGAPRPVLDMKLADLGT